MVKISVIVFLVMSLQEQALTMICHRYLYQMQYLRFLAGNSYVIFASHFIGNMNDRAGNR